MTASLSNALVTLVHFVVAYYVISAVVGAVLTFIVNMFFREINGPRLGHRH